MDRSLNNEQKRKNASELKRLLDGKKKQALINEMVDRFLRWELPRDFCPDGGIEFTEPKELYPRIKDANDNHWPTGTNLFDATQAEIMIRYLLNVAD